VIFAQPGNVRIAQTQSSLHLEAVMKTEQSKGHNFLLLEFAPNL